MSYDEYKKRVALLTDEQKERIKAKCRWERMSWLAVARDWPSLFDVPGMPPATAYSEAKNVSDV